MILDYIMSALIGVCAILMFFVFITDALSKTRKFILFFMALAAIVLLLADHFTHLYDGVPTVAAATIARLGKFLTYGMYLYIIFVFNQYIDDLLTTSGAITEKPIDLKTAEAILFIGMITLVFAQGGNLYYYYDSANFYHRLPSYPLAYLFPVCALTIQLLVIIKYRDKIRKRMLLPLVLFLTLPLAAAALQFVIHKVSITSISIVSMIVLLYCFSILDVNKIVKTAHKRELDTLLQKQKMAEEITLALAEAIDAKDKYTNGHSKRVAEYSVMIAERAGYSREDCDRIHLLAILHDVGKIGIPDAIINKEGHLTEEEFAIIKTHPTVGREILSKITISPDLAIGASFHHERYDGTGYPFGLKGEEIPEAARIIAVADTYDAMSSKRSYRDVLPREKIRSELQRGIGTQFDPRFAKIMIGLIDTDTTYQMRG